jgi:anaerobic ribonucleoside-triphosphate reductase activating protein
MGNMQKIKYIETKIVFQEIPDEISLAINITNCPNRCKGCHSPYLQRDIGDELTPEEINKLVRNNLGITCILFMGGDNNRTELNKLSEYIKNTFSLKVGYYSGYDNFDNLHLNNYDYIKLGHYDCNLGGLDSPKTNQKLFKLENTNSIFTITDLTYKLTKQ